MALRNVLLASAALLVSTAAFAGDNSVGKGGQAPVTSVSTIAHQGEAEPAAKPHRHKRHHVKKVVKEEVKKEETKTEEVKKEEHKK